MADIHWSRPALIGWNRGGVSLRADPLHVCAVCFVQTEKTFTADSYTHAILNRSGNPTSARLCVKCWSRLLEEDYGA